MANKFHLLKMRKAAWWLGFAFLIRHFVFWYLFFLVQRLLFLFHHLDKFKQQNGGDVFMAFFYGFRLDNAQIAFITLAILPFFLVWLGFRKNKNPTVLWILKIPFFLVVLFSILVHSGDIAVYREWGHKLSARVFTHLINPSEMIRTATFFDVLWFILYGLIQFFAFRFLVKALFNNVIRHAQNLNLSPWFYPIQFVLIVPLVGVLSRGGLQPIPINISAGMFSKSALINDMSTNSTYYFLQSALKNSLTVLDPVFEQVDNSEAQLFSGTQTTSCDDYELFLDTLRPNIVIVVLESWVADAISYSGKVQNSTPNFDTLIQDGLYFSNCYATSGTSEIGNASIFSGYPSLPSVSLTLNQEKSRKVTALNQTLKPFDYYSSYLFGGDLKYGNIDAYFLDHEFDDVKDERFFTHIEKRGKLNIYDTDLFEEFLRQINAKKEPFLSVAFTGSTHSPWDIPEKWNSFYKGQQQEIINTIHFADHALGQFIADAKKQPWFDNTLFIFVADHGRACPTNESSMNPEFYRIPLLFWGEPVLDEFKGVEINRIMSQADLAATLLGQMKISADDYPYSRNQMCQNINPLAIYTSTLGYGGISPDCHFFYNMSKSEYYVNSCYTDQTSLFDQVRWVLKTVWEDFKSL